MRTEHVEALFRDHAQQLFGFLAYRTGDRTLAEDVLADTFERVLRARRRFDPRKASEKTWIYSIALNRLRDLQRQSAVEHRARSAIEADLRQPDRFEDHIALRSQLQAGLTSLSPEEREVLALRFGADLTVPEVARILGEPLSRIEGRLYRGLRKLRDVVEPADAEPTPHA